MGAEGVHVVFGAGQIGRVLAERLRALGKHVRVARKSAAAVPVEGIEVERGDAMDAGFCARAVADAAVVYHCVNTPYFARVWRETLPRIQANLVAAAGRASARLVVLDNLYAYGRTGGTMSEATPQNPCSAKGEIRARLYDDLQQAVRRGDVRAAIGRASDFYGPNAPSSMLGDRVLRPILAGKSVWLIVNPDPPHTYHFTRDVAEGLARLGLDAGVDGLWMLPCAPAVGTRAMIEKFGTALGRPIDVKRVPRLAFSLLAPVVPLVRELKEMAYQWEEPFIVDDARFRARFGDRATPLDAGVRETLAWGRNALVARPG